MNIKRSAEFDRCRSAAKGSRIALSAETSNTKSTLNVKIQL